MSTISPLRLYFSGCFYDDKLFALHLKSRYCKSNKKFIIRKIHMSLLTRSGESNCPLLWLHNEHDGVSNHRHLDCLLNRLFRRRSKKTSKPRVTGLCEGNSPVVGEFPAQGASNAANVSIWWGHHVKYFAQRGTYLASFLLINLN